MNIANILISETVFLEQEFANKNELFQFVATQLETIGRISNTQEFLEDLWAREADVSTALEDGFGIPHTQSVTVLEPTISFIAMKELSDYVGYDDVPVSYAFVIAVPKDIRTMHLELLSQLSRRLMKESFRTSLKKATTSDEIIELLEGTE